MPSRCSGTDWSFSLCTWPGTGPGWTAYHAYSQNIAGSSTLHSLHSLHSFHSLHSLPVLYGHLYTNMRGPLWYFSPSFSLLASFSLLLPSFSPHPIIPLSLLPTPLSSYYIFLSFPSASFSLHLHVHIFIPPFFSSYLLLPLPPLPSSPDVGRSCCVAGTLAEIQRR